MTDPEETTADLHKRIRTLETSSRQLQIFCTLLLVIGGLSLYQNFVSRYEILDMNGSLNVRDENEMPRAILYAQDTNSGLMIYDNRDRDRAMLGATQEGSGLTLRDERSHQRMVLRVNDDGPEIIMMDNNHVIRCRITVDDSGGRIMMYDSKGEKTFDSIDMANLQLASSPATGGEADLP